MGIKTIATKMLESLREAAMRDEQNVGGPEYDDNGDTIYPDGHQVVWTSELTEKRSRTGRSR